MWRNYFKIAIRSFRKQKLTFLINLLGLSIGMTAGILILLWVRHEKSVDHFHKNGKQIYQVMENQTYGAHDIFTTNSTPGLLAKELKTKYTQVDKASTMTWKSDYVLSKGNEPGVRESGYYVQQDFFSIFTFPLVKGNPEKLLTDNSSIVVTEKVAEKLFNRTDVIGETVMVDGKDAYKITGVLQDIPKNSSLQFGFLLPYEKFFAENSWLSQWGSNGPRTVIKLRPGVQASAFGGTIQKFIHGYNEGSNVDLFLFPYEDMYLYGSFKNGKPDGGRIDYIHLFSWIGIFVLLIACINFMNLATAKSQKRAKEVGVRKVVGAERSYLVKQFLSESMIIAFLSLIVAVLLVQLALPVFNQLTEKELSFPFSSWSLWGILLGITIVTGLVAGSYPAFYLSSIQVVTIFKQKLKTNKGVTYARKGLVVFQFIMATILILATLVIYKQINFVLNRDTGFKTDHLIRIKEEGNLPADFAVMKQKLLQSPAITHVSQSGHALVGRSRNTGDVKWQGKNPDENILFEVINTDFDFIKTAGMQMASGRDFSPEITRDTSNNIIINQEAAKVMNLKNPLGQTIDLWGTDRTIVGVVKDFNFQSFKAKVAPTIMYIDPNNSYFAFVQYKGPVTQAMNSIQSAYAEINPNFPMAYSFMDDNYRSFYKDDIKMRDLAKYFSLFTIFISCLGLLGLSAHVAEQKTKEIGIRKVLGASVMQITQMINREFLVLVGISLLIGGTAAYFIMQKWLDSYASHVNWGWAEGLLVGMLVLAVAYLTVSIQSIKAALINPVKTIKEE